MMSSTQSAKWAQAATLLLMMSTQANSAFCAENTPSARPAKTQNKSTHYTWSDVAKWPDFSTGSFGRGVANATDLVARFGNTPPGSGVPGAAAGPPELPGAPAAAGGGACRGGIFCKVTDMPLTDAYRKSLDKDLHNTSLWSCEPKGVIVDSGSKFYFGKDVILIGGLSDYYNVWRRVYMDGREPPKDFEPSYFGHSVGHWEGDTLVIDTIGISEGARLGQGVKIGNYDTHVVERIRLTEPSTLEIKKTVISPSAFTKPVEFTVTHKREADYEFPEAYCWSDPDEGGRSPEERSE